MINYVLIFSSNLVFNSNFHVCLNMEYFCDVCDEAFHFNSKRKRLKSVTHDEFEKYLRTKHITQKQDFFNIDAKFNEDIHCHNKKFDL